MIIPVDAIIDRIVKTVSSSDAKPKLSVIQVGESSKIKDAIEAKKALAKKMKIGIEVITLKQRPLRYEELLVSLKTQEAREDIDATLVQQPIPSAMQSETLYNFIPLHREIEAHRPKNPFLPPMGLGLLHLIRHSIDEQIEPLSLDVPYTVDPLYNKTYRTKKIVLLGKNDEGAEPIGKTLTAMKMNYIHLFSGTAQSAITGFSKEADILINTSQKIAITPDMIKPEATVLSTVPIKGSESSELVEQICQAASYCSPLDQSLSRLRDAYLLYNVWLAATHEPAKK